MKVHYPKLHNMAHLSLNVFTASKGSNSYILFLDIQNVKSLLVYHLFYSARCNTSSWFVVII